MAIGDAAAAAGMDIVPGSTPANTIHDEITKTRDYIATHRPPDASTTVKGIAELATSAEAIAGSDSTRAVTPAALRAAGDDRYYTKAQINNRVPADATGTSLRSPSNAAALRADNDGGLYSINVYDKSVTGSGSYRAVYVNQFGAIGYVPSLRDLKELTGDQEIDIEGWLALPLRRFFYKGDPSELHRLGWFADEVHNVEPDITFTDAEGDLAGIDYAAAVVPLLALVQHLAQRVEALESKEQE